jgi:hypothetical protein
LDASGLEVCRCEEPIAMRKRIGGKARLGIYEIAESEIKLYRMIISMVFCSTYQYFYLFTGLFILDLREYCELWTAKYYADVSEAR